MHRFRYTLLMILLLPSFVFAQKKMTQKAPGSPVIINTTTSQKNIGVWPEKMPERKTAIDQSKIKKERPTQEQLNQRSAKKSAGSNLKKMGECGGEKGWATWTGQSSNDWLDAGNWDGGFVPSECEIVVIPGGRPYQYSPKISNDVTIGGLIMDGVDYLNIFYAKLTVLDTVYISGSSLIIEGDYNSGVEILNALDPVINYSYFSSLNSPVEITNFTGEALIYGNDFEVWYVRIIESNTRNSGDASIFGNRYWGDLYFTVNSDYGHIYLANGNDLQDEIYGNLGIYVNANPSNSLNIGLGSGEPLYIEGSLDINRWYDFTVYLDKVTFGGYGYSSLEVPTPTGGIAVGRPLGPVEIGPFPINKLFLRKDGATLGIWNDIIIKQQLLMGGNGYSGQMGGVTGVMISVDKDAVVVDEDPVNGSFVNSPMKKIGNNPFTFPLGGSNDPASRQGAPGSMQNTSNRPMSLYGDFKSPISISAPVEDYAEFVAEYIRANPSYLGYDISQKDADVDGILTDGFWKLTHERGLSNVNVSLGYNVSHSETNFDPSTLQITGWNGTKWISHPKGPITGENDAGMVATGSPISVYGPLALFSANIRTPILTITDLTNPDICKGSSFELYFSMDTAALEGTNFQAEISDATGNFYTSPQIVGNIQGSQPTSITINIPTSSVEAGESYKLRIISDKQQITSENIIEINIKEIPQGTPVIVGDAEACANTGSFKYYVSDKISGVTYTWSINGGTFTVDNDTAYVLFTTTGNSVVQVTPSNNCGNGSLASKTVLVKPGVPTAIPVVTNTGRWLKATAPPSGQQVAGYEWYKDGVLIPEAENLNYYAQDAGTFSMAYVNDCGIGTVSNTITFENASLPQTIIFDEIPDKTMGDAPFELTGVSSAGLPLTYTIVSGVGNVTAGVFTITQAGTITIMATQPGNNDYDTAASLIRTFTISKGQQTISFAPMDDVIFTGTTKYVSLTGTSSSGLSLDYTSSAPNVSISGKNLIINGLGNVTIKANQAGNTNYHPATEIEQTFCVRVDKLGSLTGLTSICPGVETVYRTKKIAGLTYNWALSDGTVLGSDADTVKVTWPTQGTYKVYVSAVGPCGPATQTDSLTVTVLDGTNYPSPVQNMLPANGIDDQKLPLQLSWVPGSNTSSYDLYVWEIGTTRSSTPEVPGLNSISYSVTPQLGLKYDTEYNWQVVSKNGCLQTSGPTQTFKLRKVPDLVVSEVNVPATANSGQTITISWKVKNEGTGNTLTYENWNDAVFLSFDTLPRFDVATTDQGPWNSLMIPARPLLIGTVPNVTALNQGQEYTNSMSFTLPVNYSEPLYVYVIANYKGGVNAPPESDYSNDTARAADPIDVIMSPTPDLRVDELQIPTTVFSGNTINLSYKVTNYGAPATGQWKDKIYISKSPLFDKQNAVLLKFAKTNGSYYPDAENAIVKINEDLETDDFYTRNVEVVVPNFISGTWFIHVVANEDKSIYEGALGENNDNNKSLQVILTPTPQFAIGQVNTSSNNITPGEKVSINWSVTNQGFYDNWEKNKAVYSDILNTCNGGAGPIPAGSGGSGGGGYIPPATYDVHTYMSYGGSYWEDKVYLSSDPNGLNINTATYLGIAKHGVYAAGLDGQNNPLTWIDNFAECVPKPNDYPYKSHVIKPGSVHPAGFTWEVPNNLPQGNYYIYVVANPDKKIFTYIDTTVVARSGMLTVNHPDLTVTDVTVPSSIRGGTPFQIDYTVANVGVVSVNALSRKDQVYISNNSVFDGSAVALKTFSYNESIVSGDNVVHTVTLTLPNNTSGTKYLFVKTNSASSFPEANMGNNTSAGAVTSVSTALPVDLMAANASINHNIKAPGAVTLEYQVSNVGTNNVSDTMVDKVYISCDPVFNESTAVLIGEWSGYRSVPVGGEVTASIVGNISKQAYMLKACFAADANSDAYFFVKVNATETVYEPGNMANNVAGTALKSVENLMPDVVVPIVTGDASAKVARPFNVSWQILNQGDAPTLGGGYKEDAVYFSLDSVINSSAIKVGYTTYGGEMQTGALIAKSLKLTLPAIPEGDYYVYVVNDNNHNFTNEIIRDNNFNFIRDASGRAAKIHVESTVLPDLLGKVTEAPQRIPVGQPFTVKYKIDNNGPGDAYPEKWTDNIFLSTNTDISGKKYDISKQHIGALATAGTFEDSVVISLPLNFTPGNYLLLAYPDRSNQVVETDENNNIGIGYPVEVYVPEPSDLIVENVILPDTIYLGDVVNSIQWTVRNQSTAVAKGVSMDGVYLSKNTSFDSTAILIGVKSKNMLLNPAGEETLSLNPIINNVPEGDYNVIVRTDIKNNIPETDKENNENFSVKPVYVSVKQLTLGEPLVDDMTDAKYYKLVIPDSLIGSTILLTLGTDDPIARNNEVYVGGGYIPSVLKSDYKFGQPNYGNQEVLLADITEPVYYIAVRSVSIPISQQPITLNASVLPFTILNAQSDKGGNGGNVTVKLTGSLFTEGMKASLKKGSTTIDATQVYFVNSTQVYATFPLLGKSIGVYDVKLTKPDESETTLTGGFSVVSPNNGGLYSGGGVNTGMLGSGTDPGCDPGTPAGLNSQLSVEMIVPDRAAIGVPFVVVVNYSNPTNMDIPVQTMVLYNDQNIPMAFTREGMEEGGSSLYLELTGKDGPPGVFRAGASGSVSIYTITPATMPGHTIVKFNLK